MARLTSAVLLACIAILLAFPSSGCESSATLKMGTTPVIDYLPVRLALHKPIFQENRLVVEPVLLDSPSAVRDALVSGKVDAVITDLVSGLLINDVSEGSKIVRVALKASLSHPMFAIVAAPGTSDRLDDSRIAVSGEAMSRYVADSLLNAAGVRRWTEVEVTAAETRLKMMQEGTVSAALLSEPQISMALSGGARAVLDDRSMMLGQTVVVFSARMVNDKPALIRRFLRAYEQSVRELNVRPELYCSLAADTLLAAPEVTADLSIPLFPFPGDVPTESDVESAGSWLVAKKMSKPVPYRRAVNAGFLWDPYQFRPAACCGW